MSKNPTYTLPETLVSALILVDTAAKILLARRPAGKSMAGLWEFPGGKVKDGEDEKEALIREISEELGITLKKKNLKKVITVRHSYPDFRLIMPMFLAKTWEGTPKGLEGQALAWVSPEALKDYPMPPADGPLVKKLPEILANA